MDTSARLHMLIFYLLCLFSPNMEGLGHFRLSDIKMDSIAEVLLMYMIQIVQTLDTQVHNESSNRLGIIHR